MTGYIAESHPSIIEMSMRTFIRVVLVGFAVGVATWLLSYFLHDFILKAILCGDDQSVSCVNSVSYAGNIAAVIMSVIGLTVLVKLGVFRPLLIVLATLISLWGLASWLSDVSVIESIGFTAVLYALCYGAYTWLARIRQAIIMVIVVLIIVVASRAIPAILL